MICLTLRAVHLEAAHDLSAESLLNCLFRFIAQRDKPDLIESDYGTIFVKTNNHLQEQIKFRSPKVEESMS